MADQIWQFRAFPAPNGEQAAVVFLNEPLRQGAGEASATLRNDGSAGLLWLEPGSLGESDAQTWQSKEFPAPNGEQAAVAFLNEPLRQGPAKPARRCATTAPRGCSGWSPAAWVKATRRPGSPRSSRRPTGSRPRSPS